MVCSGWPSPGGDLSLSCQRTHHGKAYYDGDQWSRRDAEAETSAVAAAALRKMRDVFWLAATLIAFTYVGYPLLLSVIARWRPKPIYRAETLPTVSIVMAARREGLRLRRKLENLQALDYPRHLVQVVVVSDGFHDETEEILRQHEADVTPIFLQDAVGKALALNAAVTVATGDVLVFVDVRQMIDPNALRELTANFADPGVGAVSGELLLSDPASVGAGDGVGLYWKIEKAVRQLESRSGSVIGVTGAIYAIRRSLYTELPPRLILDDVLVPMRIAKLGWRVIFEPRAIARDTVFPERGKEFKRKVRTLTGNYQLLQLAPWILSYKNPLLLRFISHKMLRLTVPLLLAAVFISSLLATGRFFEVISALQVVFYTAAFVGYSIPGSKRFRMVGVATTFVMLNAAAAVALYNFLSGKDEVWT